MKNEYIIDELHINKREDGDGYYLHAKGMMQNEYPCSINVQKILQPQIVINHSCCSNFISDVELTLSAKVLSDNKKLYYEITIDQEYEIHKQIQKLESQLEGLKKALKR